MRNNRRRTHRHSVVSNVTVNLLGVSMFIFAMAMGYLGVNSRCSQLQKEIGNKERELAQLERDINSERQNWENMNTPNALEAELRRAGLAMRPANPRQVVRLGADGTLYGSQASLVRLRRLKVEPVAMATSLPSRTRRH